MQRHEVIKDMRFITFPKFGSKRRHDRCSAMFINDHDVIEYPLGVIERPKE